MSKKVIFLILVLVGVVLTLVITLSGCEEGSIGKISTEPLNVKIISISKIPDIVDQGSVVELKVNLENAYKEYEMECLGDLDISVICECEAEKNCEERCLKIKTKEEQISGYVEKTIKLEPLKKGELSYTLYVPDYEGKLDFNSEIKGRLIITCKGPCDINRKPACIPKGYLTPIDINMVIKND